MADFHRLLRVSPPLPAPAPGRVRILLEIPVHAPDPDLFLKQHDPEHTSQLVLNALAHAGELEKHLRRGPREMMLFRWDWERVGVRVAVEVRAEERDKFEQGIRGSRIGLVTESLFSTPIDGYVLCKTLGVISPLRIPGKIGPKEPFCVLDLVEYRTSLKLPQDAVGAVIPELRGLPIPLARRIVKESPSDEDAARSRLRQPMRKNAAAGRVAKRKSSPTAVEELTFKKRRTSDGSTKITLCYDYWGPAGPSSSGTQGDADPILRHLLSTYLPAHATQPIRPGAVQKDDVREAHEQAASLCAANVAYAGLGRSIAAQVTQGALGCAVVWAGLRVGRLLIGGGLI